MLQKGIVETLVDNFLLKDHFQGKEKSGVYELFIDSNSTLLEDHFKFCLPRRALAIIWLRQSVWSYRARHIAP